MTPKQIIGLTIRRNRAVEILDSIPIDTPKLHAAKMRLRKEIGAIDRILTAPPERPPVIEDPANEKLYLATLRLETRRMRRAAGALEEAAKPKALPNGHAKR